jgi:hypothetical protein
VKWVESTVPRGSVKQKRAAPRLGTARLRARFRPCGLGPVKE